MSKYRLCYGPTLFLTLCLLGAWAQSYAQMTPAWTRHLSPARFQEISRGVVLPRAKGEMKFMDLSRHLSAVPLIKTTSQNWIHHKIFYSGLFSRQEKDILLKPAYAQATLGKVVYLHDKHAAFYNQLATTDTHYISQEAFEKHQKILQDLIHTLQPYYVKQLPGEFISTVFSQEQILSLLKTSQPAAYVLSPQPVIITAQCGALAGRVCPILPCTKQDELSKIISRCIGPCPRKTNFRYHAL